MNKYRYPGTQPFKTEQKDIFFGRTEDIEELYQKISLESLVVLYAKSGLGKSSILNAGIIPKIEEEGKFNVINIRFGAYSETNEQLKLPVVHSLNEIKSNLSYKEGNTFLNKLIPIEKSFWYTVKQAQIQSESKQQLLLIFDQFEELFTYPDPSIKAFKFQLSELLYTHIPQRFRETVEEEVKEKKILNREELRTLHEPNIIKVLFAIRSDRISLLE